MRRYQLYGCFVALLGWLAGCGDDSGDGAATCQSPKVWCGETCVVLEELHWSGCGTCAAGYVDSDGGAANGCETASVATCEAAEALCGETCVVLEELHWSACGTCAAGYVDSDGDAANGCETPVFSNGDCQTDHDCKGLMHVSAATCESGRCVIASCADGYADCDGAVESGCEVLGKRDFNHCGAQGLCNVGERDSGNFAGMTCLLGQQCLDGACVAVPEIVGCSDGTREGFRDLIRFNNLAACGGAWTVPGIHHNEGPACERQSGNTGTNREGIGCNVEDLCAQGWHVCLGKGDVMTRSEYGCEGIMDGVENRPGFFLTRTSSRGSLLCSPDTVGEPDNMNDIFGCGNFGCYATGGDCDPLKLSGHNLCSALRTSCGCYKSGSEVLCSNKSGACDGGGYGHSLDYFNLLNGTNDAPAWNCDGDPIGWHEARDIVISNPDSQGGVMCCKNQCEVDKDCGTGLLCRFNVCVECLENSDCASGVCTASHVCG